MKWIISSVISFIFVLSPSMGAEAKFPLWNGKETPMQYAEHTGLPPVKKLDLGNGLCIETMLIPAGQFTMGTPDVDEPMEVRFARYLTYFGLLLTGCLLFYIKFRVSKLPLPRNSRMTYSLRWLLGFIVALSLVLYGCVRNWRTATISTEYKAGKNRYESARAEEKPAHFVTLTQPFYIANAVSAGYFRRGPDSRSAPSL